MMMSLSLPRWMPVFLLLTFVSGLLAPTIGAADPANPKPCKDPWECDSYEKPKIDGTPSGPSTLCVKVEGSWSVENKVTPGNATRCEKDHPVGVNGGGTTEEIIWQATVTGPNGFSRTYENDEGSFSDSYSDAGTYTITWVGNAYADEVDGEKPCEDPDSATVTHTFNVVSDEPDFYIPGTVTVEKSTICPGSTGTASFDILDFSACWKAPYVVTWEIKSDGGDPTATFTPSSGSVTVEYQFQMIEVTSQVAVSLGSKAGTGKILVTAKRDAEVETNTGEFEVPTALPVLTGPDIIYIKKGDTLTINVTLTNDSKDCQGEFSWSAEVDPNRDFRVSPKEGMTPVLGPGGVHVIPLKVTCDSVAIATEGTLTVFASSPSGNSQIAIPIKVVEEDPVGPAMRTVIAKIQPYYEDSEYIGGMPSKYLIDLQSQVTLEGKGVPDLPLFPYFVDGVGGVVVSSGSIFPAGSSQDSRTNEKGMIFTKILLDTKFIKGDNDFPYLFFKIEDTSFINKYNLNKITKDSKADGVIAQPEKGRDGEISQYFPTVGSYCGRVPGGSIVTLAARVFDETTKSASAMGPAFLPDPQKDIGFANPVVDDGFLLGLVMLDAIWLVSKTAGPFGIVSVGLGDDEAKAAFFGFFFGLPNGVAAWGKDTIEDFKFLTVTAPTKVLEFVLPDDNVKDLFTLIPIEARKPGVPTLHVRIPAGSMLTLPARVADELVKLYEKFKGLAPQLVNQIKDTYARLKESKTLPEDLAKLFVPDFDKRLAADFFTSFYGWNPGTPEYGYGALGYVGGVVFAYVLTEVGVDVVAIVVTAGAAALPRIYALVAKIRKLPELIGLMQKSRFVAAKPTRARTFFGFGAFMGEVREAEAKLPAIMEKFPAGSADEGRLGGLLARGSEASGEKANEFAKALGKVVDSVPKELVGDVVLRLARICDDVGRNVPMSHEEVVKIGTALHRWGELEKAGKVGKVDIDRDVLGLSTGGSASGAGLLKERLKDVLIRCGDLTPAANEGIFKYLSRDGKGTVVNPDTLRALENISKPEDIPNLEKLWTSVGEFKSPTAYDGLTKIGLMKGEEVAKYANYPGVVKPPSGGATTVKHLEDSFTTMNKLGGDALEEVGKLLTDLPRTGNSGSVCEHLVRMLSNSDYISQMPHLDKCLASMGQLRNSGSCLATIRIAGQRQLGLPVVSLPGRPPPA